LHSNNAIENFVDKYISCDNHKPTNPIFVKLTHILTKGLVGKKSNHLSIQLSMASYGKNKKF
jgi:hypothetical protein